MNLQPGEIATKKSYDAHGSDWADLHYDDKFWQPEFKTFKKYLHKGKILEIGAGGGRDAGALIRMGYDYIGTDISKTFVEVAKKRVPGAKFLQQSVYELSSPQKFDGFWACAVLLHVPKARIDEALRRIRSLMKPGAIGFISVKGHYGEKVIEDNINDKTLRRLFSFWTKSGFEKVLARNKFEVLEYKFRREGRARWHIFYVKVV